MEKAKRSSSMPVNSAVFPSRECPITADLLKSGKIVICSTCRDAIREFSLYVWDENRRGDTPRKEDDHAMDEIRYFAATIAADKTEGFAVTFVER